MVRYQKVTDNARFFLEKLQQDGPGVWMDFSQRLRCIPGPERNLVPWADIQDFCMEARPADYLPLLESGETQPDLMERFIKDFVANHLSITCPTDHIIDCLKQEKVGIALLADDQFGIEDIHRVIKELCAGECFELKKAARCWLSDLDRVEGLRLGI
jgi:hypothetical protein